MIVLKQIEIDYQSWILTLHMGFLSPTLHQALQYQALPPNLLYPRTQLLDQLQIFEYDYTKESDAFSLSGTIARVLPRGANTLIRVES